MGHGRLSEGRAESWGELALSASQRSSSSQGTGQLEMQDLDLGHFGDGHAPQTPAVAVAVARMGSGGFLEGGSIGGDSFDDVPVAM